MLEHELVLEGSDERRMRNLLRGRSDASSTAESPAPSLKLSLSSEVAAVSLKALAGAAAMAAGRASPELSATDLGSRPVCFDETTTGWFSYWAAELDSAPRPHRKLWEFAAVLQGMFDRGLLVPGARALGVGVGDEPVASCLAKLGLAVTATDLPGALDVERVRRPNLVSTELFDDAVRLEAWDVTTPPPAQVELFDIVWSCGLLDQMGDADRARVAVGHSRSRLRPGGWAFHTFDFAFGAPSSIGTAMSQEIIADLARVGGGDGYAQSFDLGDHPLDGYIDPPPFDVSGPLAPPALFSDRGGAPHLKALIGGRAVTSYILIQNA